MTAHAIPSVSRRPRSVADGGQNDEWLLKVPLVAQSLFLVTGYFFSTIQTLR
jgi:hypothetical protein